MSHPLQSLLTQEENNYISWNLIAAAATTTTTTKSVSKTETLSRKPVTQEMDS